MKRIGEFIVFFATALLSGCFASDLPPLEAPSGLQKLVDLSDSTVTLEVETGGHESQTLGHQYLLCVLPLSRVYAPHIESDLRLQMSVAGGMRGYRFSPGHAESPHGLLQLTIRDLHIDGYDLLFIRKPTSSVTIRARRVVNNATVAECEESITSTNTAHFAFSAELQHALSESLLQASYKLLDCVGLKER